MKLIFSAAVALLFSAAAQANSNVNCNVFVIERHASNMDHYGEICFTQNYGTINGVSITWPGFEKRYFTVMTSSTMNTQVANDMSMAQWKTSLLLKPVGHNIPETARQNVLVEILGDGQDKTSSSDISAYYDAELKIGHLEYIMWSK